MTAVSSDAISLSIERPALYVVATPIGNLGDMSVRGIETLRALDLLLVEDTRVSRRLLQRYAIATRTESLHEHNEQAGVDHWIQRIVNERLAVGLLSDAGTPLIADPGYRLVRKAQTDRIVVRVLPGPCAAIAALSVAGIASDRFAFEGFLPPRSSARRQRLGSLINETRTLIFYEAPHRIFAMIDDCRSVFDGAREVLVARELTKLHETHYRSSLEEIGDLLRSDENAERGEFVVVLAGAEERDDSAQEQQALAMIPILMRHVSRSDAIKLAAEITGVKRNHLYELDHRADGG